MAGRGSRHHRAIQGRRWDRVRRRELERAGYRCESCGRPGRLEVHHKTPLDKGGDAWAAGNLQVLCRACHRLAHERPLSPEERDWRAYLTAMSKGF